MEWNNEETAGSRLFESAMEYPGSDYYDKFLSMVSLAYQNETNPLAFIDFILCNASFLLVFAVYLVCRYVTQVSLYHQLLFSVCLTPLFLHFFINYAPFLFLEEDIKWIRRESRLLNAISEDASKVSDLWEQLDSRAYQILSPNVYSGGATTKGLNEIEVAWVAKTKYVVQEAEALMAEFEKQRRRESHVIHRIGFGTIRKIAGLFTETKRIKEEVNDSIVMKKAYGMNICESLERTRSNCRSQLDRGIEDHEQNRVDSKTRVASAAALTSSTVETINLLITQYPDLKRDTTVEQILSIKLQFMLLHYFLKDLQEIQFESQTEEAWVEELEEVVNEARIAIGNFLHRPKYQLGWLSIISSWKARRKLKGDIKCIKVGLSDHLERKERYGFNFIRRDSSKIVIYQSLSHSTDDTIISSVLDRMRNQLLPHLNQEPGVFGQVLNEVTLMCNQLELTYKLFDDIARIGARYNSRMAWGKEMRKIVQSAENSVETFLNNSNAPLRNHLFKTRAEKIKLSHEIGQISQTVDLFVRCIKAFSIVLREEVSSSVVGLEDDICELVSRLTTSNGYGSVIPILGIRGIGKTTLANKIYNHGAVVRHFSRRVWISLPWKSNASWVHEVHDSVDGERYLLVLDNISTMEELDTALAAGLPKTSNGSRILFTTNDNNLASKADSPPCQLRLRTKEESWKLFIQMVHIAPEEEMRAKHILGKCGGLPLAIICLGYLASGKDVSGAELETLIMNDDIKPLLETYTTESIHLLPPHLFEFFAYLTLFPTDFEIPTRRLISLWIAEGFVEVENMTEQLEDVAERYLSELIDRDIIQIVRRKANGKVKTCCLPGTLQDVVSQASMDRSRLTDHLKRDDPNFSLIHGGGRSNSHFRSFLSFDTREGNKPGREIGNFLRRAIASGIFQRLRVLDLEHVLKPEMPHSIGILSELRYLGLRWTFIETFPASIGTLLNLQTFDLKHTYVRALPSSIWKLQKLRHLYLNQSYRTKFIGGSSLMTMKNLHTLWGLFVDKNSPLKDELDKVINLRKLGLAFQLDLSKQKVLAEWIEKLQHLKSLKIRSIDEMGKPRDLIFMRLSALYNLSSLNLFGKLHLSILAELPYNLTDLTLSASSLSDDPMPKLEKLVYLKSLSFHSNSYTGNKMSCSSFGFPRLVVLKLWKLEQLEDWDIEENAMPNLRELEIRSCIKLKVPVGFRQLKTLTELKLTNMPDVFAATIAQIKGQLWADVNHTPAINTETW